MLGEKVTLWHCPMTVRDSCVAVYFWCGSTEHQKCTVSPAACRGKLMMLEYGA